MLGSQRIVVKCTAAIFFPTMDSFLPPLIAKQYAYILPIVSTRTNFVTQIIFMRTVTCEIFHTLFGFKGEKVSVQKTVDSAADVRDNLAKSLYSRLFSWIVLKINSCLKETHQGLNR